MNWNQLISDKRLGLEDYHDPHSGVRSDFQRDFDRLVFSSPFRRLQNKTQVFPLPGSIFVHNRLTHSMEVSTVGRSMANEISIILRQRHADAATLSKLDSIGEIVAAACLAHDLGNPPFGHSGEKAISAFFSEGEGRVLQNELSPEQWTDLTHFEGNANSLRLLTHQFRGRRKGGFAMTYSMLASIVKYPYESLLAGEKSKFGFFTTERATFRRIADELGIKQMPQADGRIKYTRHPLVYIVEAADDICYQVMDIEDAHKLKILSTQEVIDVFLNFFPESRKDHMRQTMDHVDDPNERIAYLRSCVIGTLVQQCAVTFADHEEELLEGNFSGSLIDNINPLEREAYRSCSALAWAKIYRAQEVVNVELAGNRIITFLLEKLIHAVRFPELNYSKLLLSQIPLQYDTDAPTLFEKIQAVLDHISGMTDVYALNLYRKLYGMSLPAV
ncbi:MAG: dNTP triphosphohydrolase [Muribaculum sp.]|nr:dNTP triphosphohydrolase [Muribaculaceae bacterium]MCM1080424.1 dNTP triphosphohydrolase [Muribaculum sp.]